MYPSQAPTHPRAAIAIGLAIAAVWLGGLGAALATGEPADERHTPPPAETRR